MEKSYSDIISRLSHSLWRSHKVRLILKKCTGKGRGYILQATYYSSRNDVTPKKRTTISDGFSIRESEMLAKAWADGFKFYSNKTK